MSDSKPRYFVPAAGEGGMTELHDAACRGDFDAVVARAPTSTRAITAAGLLQRRRALCEATVQ